MEHIRRARRPVRHPEVHAADPYPADVQADTYCRVLAVIGLMRLAHAVRTRRGATFLLAGGMLMAAGMVLPSGVGVIFGTMILLRGVAVTLGVSEPHRHLNGASAGRADYFGFGTRPAGDLHDRADRAGISQSPLRRPRVGQS